MALHPSRFTVLSVAVVLTAMTLSGCGFRPLYADRSGDSTPGVADALSTIAIRPLPDRQGIKLRQVLREQLQVDGDGRPIYDLQVQLTSRIEELGIRRDATSSRANLIMTATFFLNEGGQQIFGDRAQAIASYNILDEQFATVASQAEAENRAIRRIGEEIKARLAIFLHRRMNAKPAAKPVAMATP